MRYTPQGHAVTSFAVATNRTWKTNEVEREETEFHNVVAWNKLAELCHQLLKKGTRVYIQGRMQTRSWQGADGAKRTRMEIVADDMVVLDSRRPGTSGTESTLVSEEHSTEPETDGGGKPKESSSNEGPNEEVPTDEIPF